MLKITSPTILRIECSQEQIKWLKSSLEYIDKKIDYTIQRYKKNAKWWSYKLGSEKLEAILEKLKDERKKTLLFQDNEGYYTYSGLAGMISGLVKEPIINEISYPKTDLIPWETVPTIKLRFYQQEAIDKLIEIKHGAISLPTGSGKTVIILYICKILGLKTVIMAPSNNICNQIYDLFLKYFGKKYVGKYVGTKKEYKKLFTIGTAQSLTRVDKESIEWEHLSKSSVFLTDESHLIASESLKAVAFGLCAKSTYRFFLSATQLRNDGLDILLNSIIGPIVLNLTPKLLVEKGFLAKPIFKIIQLESLLNKDFEDPNENTRKHLYYNKKVNEVIGKMTNFYVEKEKKSVLILIEELEQFSCILPYLKHEVKLAYSGTASPSIPKEYQNHNTNKLVDEFNEGKFPILIGTSAVSTGTDFKSVEVLIYVQGKKSEIKVRQSLGRGTRIASNPLTNKIKNDFIFIDFDITNNRLNHRHAMERLNIYKTMSDKIDVIKYRG